MRERNKHDIISDLRSVGVRQEAAEIAAMGATRTGSAAQTFSSSYQNLISLTDSQQRQLLDRIIRHYEDVVKRVVDFPITQYQFDALVSSCPGPTTGRQRRSEPSCCKAPLTKSHCPVLWPGEKQKLSYFYMAFTSDMVEHCGPIAASASLRHQAN